jgi:hypothetical protein
VERVPRWAKAVMALQATIILLTLFVKNRHHLCMINSFFCLKSIVIKWPLKDGSGDAQEATPCPVQNPGLRSLLEVNNLCKKIFNYPISHGILLLLLPPPTPRPRRCWSSR